MVTDIYECAEELQVVILLMALSPDPNIVE